MPLAFPKERELMWINKSLSVKARDSRFRSLEFIAENARLEATLLVVQLNRSGRGSTNNIELIMDMGHSNTACQLY